MEGPGGRLAKAFGVFADDPPILYARTAAILRCALGQTPPRIWTGRSGDPGEGARTSPHVLRFREIEKTKRMVVAGNEASLGEPSRLKGMCVPRGSCATTVAYKVTIGQNDECTALLDRLAALAPDDTERIVEVSRQIRGVIEATTMASCIERAIRRRRSVLGASRAHAARPSATAEDRALASFAGPPARCCSAPETASTAARYPWLSSSGA